MHERERITTSALEIGYETAGDVRGWPVVLLHGFPYDVRSFDGVVERLVDSGARAVVPYLRGFGPTRFRDAAVIRSGQQGALGADLLELIDSLHLDQPIVAGYDWGGRAACIVAALWPARIAGLVSVDGYNIQYLPDAMRTARPEFEHTYWYQYYLHSERGRRALQDNREELCRLLWKLWSPTWPRAVAEFEASRESLHNPDFVEVVVHSYRHRFGLVAGDSRYDQIESALVRRPRITVPTVVLAPGADGVFGPDPAEDRAQFGGGYELTRLPNIGHNVPQEDPDSVADAIERIHRAG